MDVSFRRLILLHLTQQQDPSTFPDDPPPPAATSHRSSGRLLSSSTSPSSSVSNDYPHHPTAVDMSDSLVDLGDSSPREGSPPPPSAPKDPFDLGSLTSSDTKVMGVHVLYLFRSCSFYFSNISNSLSQDLIVRFFLLQFYQFFINT